MASTTTELAEFQRVLTQLKARAGALRQRYGDAAVVRRIHNDIERLDIDTAELSTVLPAPRHSEEINTDVVIVPDTPYDPSLWQDADDEGLGGHPRR
ncbi:hypothetical protein EIL87_16880 [Saccharopolyspora rhizosphaerae]|uniref:Uncharacterized protein n=1 Tax=Saccharopolyspora rhizosphaerae TaxID=2492662 RepID=A0A3R8Q8W9_9PSEU|nr:hypothetical protein [Saccharopolyspora rhizosphaerae]RRO15680.1 hypothetical protein EIL87_16880 [Saccharopolyspora rhizosphaerae]